MKLLIAFMLLASIKSNGQWSPVKKPYGLGIIDTSKLYTIANQIYLNQNSRVSARINNNSDTLVVLDTVLLIYGYRIRYIKIKDKVYPLLTPKP